MNDPGGEVIGSPIGSVPWAQRLRLEMQNLVSTLPHTPKSLKAMLDVFQQKAAWRLLNTSSGGSFSSFQEFCEAARPFGLETSIDYLKGFFAAMDNDGVGPQTEFEEAVQDFNELVAMRRELDKKIQAAFSRLEHFVGQGLPRLLDDLAKKPPELAPRADGAEVCGSSSPTGAEARRRFVPSMSSKHPANDPTTVRSRFLMLLESGPLTSAEVTKQLGADPRRINDASSSLRSPRTLITFEGKGGRYHITEDGRREAARLRTLLPSSVQGSSVNGTHAE